MAERGNTGAAKRRAHALAPRAAYAACGPGHSGAPLVRPPRGSHQDQGRGARDVLSATRPTGLVEPRGPQERVQRHTMEQFVRVAPMVQILDAPVPQMVDKLEDVLKIVDHHVPVQVVEVPKISCLSCPPPRRVLPEPQSAEQLVEVPTVLSPLRIEEQIVGTPVPRGRGKRRLQGFLPVQSSTAAPSSGKRISERTVEQIVDTSSGGGLGQGSSSSAGPADEDFTGFSHFFPMDKKCGVLDRR